MPKNQELTPSVHIGCSGWQYRHWREDFFGRPASNFFLSRAKRLGSAPGPIRFFDMSRSERIAGWMRRQLHSSGARGFVVGLSGGIDSAVVARLAQLAAPGHVLAVILPCHSDPRDTSDA